MFWANRSPSIVCLRSWFRFRFSWQRPGLDFRKEEISTHLVAKRMTVFHFDKFNLLAFNMLTALGLVVVLSISICGSTQTLRAQDQGSSSSLPQWIEKDHWQEDGEEMIVVRTEGFLLISHATMALVDLVRAKVGQEIDVLVHAGASDLVSLPDSYVEANLVQDELILDSRELDSSFAGREKYYGFAKLHFSQAFRETVERRYQRNFRTGRLTWTGVAGAMALGWLAVAWGFLRLDRMTRHFYSRRLQTAAIVLAVGILAAGVVALLSLDPLWPDPPR